MMKKCIFGLIFLTNICFSQETLSIEPSLEKYVMKYVNDGLDRGVNVMPLLMKNVDTIVFNKDLNFPTLGRFDSHNKVIEIALFVTVDSLIVRSTMYHEITHGILWSSEHTCKKCDDIMSMSSPPTFSIYADKKVWSDEIDKLFKLIKEKTK